MISHESRNASNHKKNHLIAKKNQDVDERIIYNHNKRKHHVA